MNCLHCNTLLNRGPDKVVDPDVMDEWSIVTILTCPKCNAFVEVFLPVTD
jgi:hypothetical protein